MRRFPKWLKIAIPVVILLLLAVAALVKVMVEELPEYAQAPAIQKRFGEQIEILLDLARGNPSDGCVDESSPRSVMKEIEIMNPWWSHAEAREAHFRDPAILGADVVYDCEGSTRSFGVKPYEEPTAAWSRSLVLPSQKWPAVSLWYAGEKRLIRYEDRLEGVGVTPRGIRLILDLDVLAGGKGEAQDSNSGAAGEGTEGGGMVP